MDPYMFYNLPDNTELDSNESIQTRLSQLGIQMQQDKKARDWPTIFRKNNRNSDLQKQRTCTGKEDLPPWLAGVSRCVKVIHNVLTKEECDHLIELSERCGYEQAYINTFRGHMISADRNNMRTILDSEFLANDIIFERIKKYVPQALSTTGGVVEMDPETPHEPEPPVPSIDTPGRKEQNNRSDGKSVSDARTPDPKHRKGSTSDIEWHLQGCNKRLRFLRYEPGQRFAIHRDGCFRDENERDNREEMSFFTVMIYLNDVDCGQSSDGNGKHVEAHEEDRNPSGDTQMVENGASIKATNDQGGGTTFYRWEAALKYEKHKDQYATYDDLYKDWDEKFVCQPRAGSVLIFDHSLTHAGSELKKGLKYTMRSDIMYEKRKNRAKDEWRRKGAEGGASTTMNIAEDTSSTTKKDKFVVHVSYDINELFGKSRNVMGWQVKTQKFSEM